MEDGFRPRHHGGRRQIMKLPIVSRRTFMAAARAEKLLVAAGVEGAWLVPFDGREFLIADCAATP